SIFSASNVNMGILGTIIQSVGKSDVPASMTTPEAHRLQKMLLDAVSEGMDGIIMEASSHALELKRVDDIKFDVAVFTNLTQDHLDFHRDMDGYLAAKIKLFHELMKNDKPSFAIINNDDPAAKNVISNTKAEVITYAVNSKADVKILDFQSTPEGMNFKASIFGKKEFKARLQLLGDHNLYNALSALSIGVSQNFDLEAIKNGLESVSSVPGRFERVNSGQDFTVVVDYAHTPDALERVLKAARKLTEGKLIAVFGCGGDRDKGKRPIMGHAATELSDYSVVTSDNPRSEDPIEIISQIQAGIDKRWSEGKRYELISDRRSAIQKAINIAEKGDVVVIAGKGHENYQIIGAKRNHFDDREEASEAIKNRLTN
ncbi:UDP-N-acetylmuramoyl-L-alanyl-D-glutamate--2,6-diaminopimelate ligase, partial [Candidatus Poribacteria bacterium]|nr:UDP-N-acetylmuramoyl-L-alanyl-D-glutamate--2,6-diaminopimelate ligase [Candidatus Poribacteria bacterium]